MLTQSYANTNSIWHSAHVCDLYANVQKCSCVLFRFLSYLNVYYFICVVFSLCGLLSSQRWSILACFDEEHVEVKPQKYTEWTNELPRTETSLRKREIGGGWYMKNKEVTLWPKVCGHQNITYINLIWNHEAFICCSSSFYNILKFSVLVYSKDYC